MTTTVMPSTMKRAFKVQTGDPCHRRLESLTGEGRKCFLTGCIANGTFTLTANESGVAPTMVFECCDEPKGSLGSFSGSPGARVGGRLGVAFDTGTRREVESRGYGHDEVLEFSREKAAVIALPRDPDDGPGSSPAYSQL